MNSMDPNAPDLTGMDFVEEELSIEEAAQMEADETAEDEAVTEAAEEPTTPEPADEDVAAARRVPRVPKSPIPVTPIPLKRRVSGRYRNCPRPWELTLRVDVDGYRPMKRVSGDFHRVSGATASYYGSFVVNAPSVTVTATQATIVGLATTTWPTSYNKIRVVIPRHTIFQPPAAAHVQWMTTGNKKGASYTCLFETHYFRTVDLEQDQEKGVTQFASYNTGSLPSGGSARTLTVAQAYAEAGIEMRDAGVSNVVPTAPGSKWSNAELHAAMEKHFSLWKDATQWKVWLFHAMRHDLGPGLLGIMFDQKGKQRQGCAAFYQRIAGTGSVKLRDQLYVSVHELGHCFNLFHSFHKKYMKPPMPNRLSALSWMNYPKSYPGGAGAFWNAFPFQFDNLEVIHLRHAFRNNIIIGGNPFGTGAALEVSEGYTDSLKDQSGLRLELEAPESVALGQPVVTEIKLYVTDLRGKRVHKHLHPNYGFVQVAIQKPSGEAIAYEPPIEHCVEVETTMLDVDNPSIFESAYIGFDKERGCFFDQPGTYKLRGAYYALDGSVVLSNVLTLRVRTPLSSADDEVAELFVGDEQGMLLYLLGSDSELLASGNNAFDSVLEKHPKHPLAVYAQLVKGYNLGREFKSITTDYQVKIRKTQHDKANKLLSGVVDASEADRGVDNITLNMTMRYLAGVQKEAGDQEGAKKTMDRMVRIFQKKKLRPHVMKLIESQAKL